MAASGDGAILRAEFARRADTKARFRQEARAASSVETPHIVDVSDFGTLPDGSTYLVMEYLEGVALSTLTRDQKPIALDKAIAIARQVADGLAEVHDRGIVHRDLKPDNIFLVREGEQEDFVKILDFGIAKVLESTEAKVTCAGSLFGTPSYMSPEQAAGMPVDARTDVYALGIMYELASGRVPFDADTLMGILTAPLPKTLAAARSRRREPRLGGSRRHHFQSAFEGARAALPEHARALRRSRCGGRGAHPRRGGRDGLSSRLDSPAKEPEPALKEMPVPVPATPRPKLRTPWGLYAGGTAILVACGLVMGVLIQGSRSYAESGQPEEARRGPVTVALSDEQVLLSIEPLDAHVFQGSTDLGAGPYLLQVPADRPLSLEVRREGYKSRRLTLDGSQKRLGIKLVPEAPTRPR